MSSEIIESRLAEYKLTSPEEEWGAIREIVQELALAALSQSGLFKYAAFQGGTCLRIVHGLQRFSEDLDFALAVSDVQKFLKPIEARGLVHWGPEYFLDQIMRYEEKK